MLNWFKKDRAKAEDTPSSSSDSITLKVIGDRASGKTTYLASLARYPNANSDSPVLAVTPFNDDGIKLVTLAQDMLEQGLKLEPTRLNEHADADTLEIPDYGLTLVIQRQSSLRKPQLGGTELKLTLNCKDYSGEFFSDLLYRTGDPLLQSYLDDCCEANAILFLVDGIAYRKDTEYAKALDIFLEAFGSGKEGKKSRIALVLSKCEQPDLWVNRHDPRKLVTARFPEVYRKLETWQKLGKRSVDYFTCSAFGMLGTRYPEANAKQIRRGQDGVVSVIKDPKNWRPFGLVAPIYWLYTGERHQGLEKD